MSYYGNNLTPIDASILELALLEVIPQGVVRFLEIGTNKGETARGAKDYVETRGSTFQYWGVDNCTLGLVEPPFDGARIVLGDSVKVFYLIPKEFDVVFIDGCHSFNHVVLDTLHYGWRVRQGGMLLFHDTAPHVQGTLREPEGPDIPEFHCAVNLAHQAMNFPTSDWVLFKEGFDPKAKIGGMRVYQKL